MIVDRAARQQGIGRRLIAALEDEARTQGCTQVLLVTEADRADACSFYASAGYAAEAHRGFKKKL
jgi:GNAT superfamily N-acetyltransferase